MKPITVLSLFDGMSCGQIALERAGIPVKKYYASEIDKYAIKVTQYHYPKTVQLGSVLNWKDWKLPKIDLLIGGSPCQGFSNAGLGLNFDDPRSKLFFTFVDIRNDLVQKNPDLKFMLENVKMKQAWKDIITEHLGVEPVLINSALVSAQNRQRLYWANWDIPQPEDKGIMLADVIENGEVDRCKSYTIDANYFKGGNPRSYFEDGRRQLIFEHQSHKRAMVKIDKSLYLTDKEIEEIAKKKAAKTFASGKSEGAIQFPQTLNRKSLCLLAGGTTGNHRTTNVIDDHVGYRKLTPIECERLQTVEDNWTSIVSNTQRYKMLGNGWTIDVIAHILSYL